MPRPSQPPDWPQLAKVEGLVERFVAAVRGGDIADLTTLQFPDAEMANKDEVERLRRRLITDTRSPFAFLRRPGARPQQVVLVDKRWRDYRGDGDGDDYSSVTCFCRTADCTGRWPIARFDADDLSSRPYACARVGGPRWWVTRFRREVLRAGQTVHILPSDDYWRAMRQHADVVIVDAPAADRSQAAVTIAPFMDQTVLVVAADEPDVKAPALLRDAVTGAGGAISGLFFNRAVVAPPRFLRGVLP